MQVFESMGVLSEHELHARNEVKWEMYVKKIQIESRVLGDLCLNHIVPVATRYQTMMLDNIRKVREVFDNAEYEQLSAGSKDIVRKICIHLTAVHRMVEEMIEARKKANRIEDMRERALVYERDVFPYLNAIRYHVDHLELIVDDEMWPLPKYRELLFVQ